MQCGLTAWTELLKAAYPFLALMILAPLALRVVSVYSRYLQTLERLERPSRKRSNGSDE